MQFKGDGYTTCEGKKYIKLLLFVCAKTDMTLTRENKVEGIKIVDTDFYVQLAKRSHLGLVCKDLGLYLHFANFNFSKDKISIWAPNQCKSSQKFIFLFFFIIIKE